MNLLLLNQYYPPDTAPTGRYLHDLAQELVRRGHQVTVLCSQKAYNGSAVYPARETMDGVVVRRVWSSGFGRRSGLGKVVDYASFFLSLAWHLFRPGCRPDLVLSLTTPPYLGLLARLKRCVHAHWVMDIYPDVLAAHGVLPASSPVYRFLAGLTRLELRGSRLVAVLGRDMAEVIRRHLGGGDPFQVRLESLPLWPEPSLFPWSGDTPPPFRREQGWSDQDLVLMYSGNMGRGHRLGEFLQAAEEMKAERTIHWVFAGGGKRRDEVAAALQKDPGLNLRLLPYAPYDRLREHLCSADVHLVSLDSAWQGCMVPSKFQGIFAVGRPVILVGGNDNSLAQWIRESGGGWVVPENDTAALRAAVEEARDESERERRGRAARVFAEKNFNRDINLQQLAGWLEACVQSR